MPTDRQKHSLKFSN